MFDFFASNMLLGRPMLATPGVPEDRVEALRRAFDATMQDDGFLREAAAMGFEVRPQTGEEVAKRVAESVKTPQHVIDRTQKAAVLE